MAEKGKGLKTQGDLWAESVCLTTIRYGASCRGYDPSSQKREPNASEQAALAEMNTELGRASPVNWGNTGVYKRMLAPQNLVPITCAEQNILLATRGKGLLGRGLKGSRSSPSLRATPRTLTPVRASPSPASPGILVPASNSRGSSRRSQGSARAAAASPESYTSTPRSARSALSGGGGTPGRGTPRRSPMKGGTKGGSPGARRKGGGGGDKKYSSASLYLSTLEDIIAKEMRGLNSPGRSGTYRSQLSTARSGGGDGGGGGGGGGGEGLPAIGSLSTPGRAGSGSGSARKGTGGSTGGRGGGNGSQGGAMVAQTEEEEEAAAMAALEAAEAAAEAAHGHGATAGKAKHVEPQSVDHIEKLWMPMPSMAMTPVSTNESTFDAMGSKEELAVRDKEAMRKKTGDTEFNEQMAVFKRIGLGRGN